MLKLWNTATRSLEEFKPLHPPEVGLYTCGPTVYNPATIGNLRTYVFEDVLKKTLRLFGYQVKHVMNITDVGHLVGDGDEGEDKIEREAAKQKKSAWEIAKEYETRFWQDMDRLNILRPDEMPHATAHIPEQIKLIEELERKGFTYKTSDGIYFDTQKFPEYGKLSGQKLSEKEAGARVEVNQEKHHPADFALWKFSPTDQKRQMEWKSPWGVGFPGWHIECSAMSVKYLGQPFDIHCGGVDHIPVHHENEIAQSEAAYGKPLANLWMHGEFLLVDGRRMGKSEGNAYTLDDLIAKGFDPLAFRYYCLGTKYNAKLNFTWEGMQGAQNAYNKLVKIARSLPKVAPALLEDCGPFMIQLEDNLNTPHLLGSLWDELDLGVLGEMLQYTANQEKKSALLLKIDEVLGLGLKEVIGKPIMAPSEVTALAEQREEARKNKDWKESDRLRDEIRALGWEVEDGPEGSTLVPKV